MLTSDFDYHLDERFIAQNPVSPRDMAKLMVFDSATGEVHHRVFRDIGDFLNSGDHLVLNRSRVIPARILFDFQGKSCEIFLLRSLRGDVWRSMVRPGKLFKEGVSGEIEDLKFTVSAVSDDGTREIFFQGDNVEKSLLGLGKLPLPPYIKNSVSSFEDYQTVYAKEAGSVAAPTAGLHFTKELLGDLKDDGVKVDEVLLHVGRGTFLPVSAEKVEEHVMHSEFYQLLNETAASLNNVDGRVVAVGTTSVRVLESSFNDGFEALAGETDIFIYPGAYKWKVVDALITNFHLPKSSLIMLVASFLEHKGVERPIEKILELYELAKEKGYRFYSFGDAMLIL